MPLRILLTALLLPFFLSSAADAEVARTLSPERQTVPAEAMHQQTEGLHYSYRDLRAPPRDEKQEKAKVSVEAEKEGERTSTRAMYYSRSK